MATSDPHSQLPPIATANVKRALSIGIQYRDASARGVTPLRSTFADVDHVCDLLGLFVPNQQRSATDYYTSHIRLQDQYRLSPLTMRHQAVRDLVHTGCR